MRNLLCIAVTCFVALGSLSNSAYAREIEGQSQDGLSPANQFISELFVLSFKCSLKATLMNDAYRYGQMDKYAAYSKEVTDCQGSASSGADLAIKKFEKSNPSIELREGAKNYYSKWAAYLNNLGDDDFAYYEKNLEISKSEFRAIEKFSK